MAVHVRAGCGSLTMEPDVPTSWAGLTDAHNEPSSHGDTKGGLDPHGHTAEPHNDEILTTQLVATGQRGVHAHVTSPC